MCQLYLLLYSACTRTDFQCLVGENVELPVPTVELCDLAQKRKPVSGLDHHKVCPNIKDNGIYFREAANPYCEPCVVRERRIKKILEHMETYGPQCENWKTGCGICSKIKYESC